MSRYTAETITGLVRAALAEDGRPAYRVSLDAGRSHGGLTSALRNEMAPHSAAFWLHAITGRDYAIAAGAGWAVAMPEAEMRAALRGES